MKILFKYLKPHKWLVILVLALAAVNIGFSLIDPILFGKLINLANAHMIRKFDPNRFFHSFSWSQPGVWFIVICSISVAMVSRIAKNFQDYFLNVVIQKFGAKVFTDGLQHAMKLPYQEFEDQRSGETLSVLQKVRTDTERFMSYFVNVLFTVILGIAFVGTFAFSIHWSLPPIYFGGMFLLVIITN